MKKDDKRAKIKKVTLTTNQTVRIPTEIVKRMDIGPGSEFAVQETKYGIVLVPLVQIPKSQLYFWTKEWQEAERKVDEDIAAGRVKSFGNMEDFLKELESHMKKSPKKRKKK